MLSKFRAPLRQAGGRNKVEARISAVGILPGVALSKTPGAPVTVRVTVQNTGGAPGNATLTVVYAGNAMMTPVTLAVPPGTSAQLTGTFTVPATAWSDGAARSLVATLSSDAVSKESLPFTVTVPAPTAPSLAVVPGSFTVT